MHYGSEAKKILLNNLKNVQISTNKSSKDDPKDKGGIASDRAYITTG